MDLKAELQVSALKGVTALGVIDRTKVARDSSAERGEGCQLWLSRLSRGVSACIGVQETA